MLDLEPPAADVIKDSEEGAISEGCFDASAGENNQMDNEKVTLFEPTICTCLIIDTSEI